MSPQDAMTPVVMAGGSGTRLWPLSRELFPKQFLALTGKDTLLQSTPQQNACVDRFNRTVRYEWLSVHLWANLEDVQACATEWMRTCNHERPHMALGGITPKQRLTKTA